jgi:hypothetical protein
MVQQLPPIPSTAKSFLKMSALPPYAQFPSSIIAQPPCEMHNANMFGFFLAGDLGRIQQYLDQTVGVVPGYEFKAISRYCMLTFTDIEQIRSTTAPWSTQGYFQETDVIVWIPVARMINGRIDHIYWYPGFICVNNPLALINGRETWGFNKYLCECTMPGIGGEPDFFNTVVSAFKRYSPDTPLAPCELFRVELVKKGREDLLTDVLDLARQGAELLHGTGDGFAIDIDLVRQMVSGLLHPQVDQLLFKQLPSGDATGALYQDVLHSPSVVRKVHNVRLFFHEFQFTLQQVDMFPLDAMFGIALGSQTPVLPFNVLFDFGQEAALAIK